MLCSSFMTANTSCCGMTLLLISPESFPRDDSAVAQNIHYRFKGSSRPKHWRVLAAAIRSATDEVRSWDRHSVEHGIVV